MPSHRPRPGVSDGASVERALRPVSAFAAFAIGTVGVVLVGGVVLLFGEDSSRIIHAALLVIPVIGTGLLGGRATTVAVSAEAAIAFTLFLEPFGSFQVYAPKDLIALLVFFLAAAATGAVVATVVDAERRRVVAEHGRLETLERTEQQRKALLRSVSHDLRTPLSTIRGASEELYNDVGHDAAARHELLGMVLTETERLDRIVANMLSLSRIDAGALLPDRRPVRLDELVRESTRRLESVLVTRTVTTSVGDDLPLVEVDPSQLDQVVTNVLENAARHTPPQSTITIEIRAVGELVELTVSDDGDGFPPGSEDKLFEPFAMATGAGSSGIGLAISRSIVEANGGAMTAANGIGGGAEVRVTVPVVAS